VSQLPDADRANVEEAKVRDYLLNAGHPENGGKSPYFQAFGFPAEHWTVMRDALVGHAIENNITESSHSLHGTKHIVRCSIRTPDQRNPCIATVWIIDDDRPPRLVTSYPLSRKTGHRSAFHLDSPQRAR
jgi:hypothetical protein